MVVELSALVDELRLVNHQRARSLDLIGAVCEPPHLVLTMDGASTLTVTVSDHDRKILRAPLLQYRSWAVVGKVRFELVGLAKTGDRVTLTFEDAIAAALRRRKKPLSAPAGSTTRAEFLTRLAREAHVPYLIDPTKRPNVRRVLERSAHGDVSDSWDVSGEVAEEVHWRRFSDGKHFIVGSDEWLIGRDKNPTRLREHTASVQDIDFDLDVAKRASTASLTVDARLWALPPGGVCRMGDDMGPGEGAWLVGEFDRPLTSSRATVKLVRKRHALKEPKREGAGEAGSPDFLPGQAGTSGGTAGTPARERMVQFALAQTAKPYIWGGSGPAGFDCSGLVQEATRAGGRVLVKPSASQWGTVVAAGKTVTIATALGVRGALLFRIGVAEYNHVAISLGNGSTVEARGSADGIGVFGGAAGGGWTGAGIWI